MSNPLISASTFWISNRIFNTIFLRSCISENKRRKSTFIFLLVGFFGEFFWVRVFGLGFSGSFFGSKFFQRVFFGTGFLAEFFWEFFWERFFSSEFFFWHGFFRQVFWESFFRGVFRIDLSLSLDCRLPALQKDIEYTELLALISVWVYAGKPEIREEYAPWWYPCGCWSDNMDHWPSEQPLYWGWDTVARR